MFKNTPRRGASDACRHGEGRRRSLRGVLKALRMQVKVPTMRWIAALAAGPLDRRPRVIEDLDLRPPRRILVVRCDRIGDLLCSTPLIAALHRKWPEAEITLVGSPKNRALAPLLPYLVRGPEFRRDPLAWGCLVAWLRHQRFDLAVSLRTEVLSGVLIAALSRAPVRMVANASPRTAPAFNLVLGCEDAHHLRRYWRAAQRLGIAFSALRPVIEVPEAADHRAAAMVRTLAIADATPLVGVAIPNRVDRRHRIRAWSADTLVRFVKALVAHGACVVLLAAGVEQAEAAAVRAAVPQTRVLPNLTLAEMAGVQHRLDLWVSTPTGPVHLADAVGTPTVMVCTDPFLQGWAPQGARHRQVCAAHARDIAPEAVLAAALELLAQQPAGVRRRSTNVPATMPKAASCGRTTPIAPERASPLIAPDPRLRSIGATSDCHPLQSEMTCLEQISDCARRTCHPG
jgi:ADP-heptose:LPS heptosyltransferase